MTMNTAGRTVAIHQPNFFPWLGFFHKMACTDVFVLMDNVQLPRTGRGSWVNRVRILVGGEPRWATMPVVRAHGSMPGIDEVKVDNSQPWRTKLLRSIELNYARARHFRSVMPLIGSLIEQPAERLVDYNHCVIRTIAEWLELQPELVLGSTLDAAGQATDLLIEMVRQVRGTAYLYGTGAVGYQEDEKIAGAGIKLVPQRFDHPEYPQVGSGPFVAGLSIIDVLMNCGTGTTRRMVQNSP